MTGVPHILNAITEASQSLDNTYTARDVARVELHDPSMLVEDDALRISDEPDVDGAVSLFVQSGEADRVVFEDGESFPISQ